tara:strand:- start:782 stop:2146 length:1365 start_codon:yes stop_codon:yes gene_type:complete
MDCFKIGVLGAVDSGKSTLIGVLKTNKNDDGRGLVRKYVMKHNHELQSGRTSCISYNVINIEDKLFNFVDLAGHESYLKTTIYGLNALELNYVLIIVGANMGVNNITREHFNLARVLQLPIIFIINKIDICPENILNETLKDLKKMVKSKKCAIKPLEVVENNELLDNEENSKILFYNSEKKQVFLNNDIKLIENYDKIREQKKLKMNENIEENNTPIFFISNKLGYGINNLRNYLCKIHKIKSNIPDIIKTENKEKKTNIFIIQETYTIKGIGIVFYGYMKKGQISRNDVIKIGPLGANFYNIHIRNVRDVLDNDVDTLYEGQLGCLAIKQLSKEFTFKREQIKKGVYLTSNPYCCQQFVARIHILHHPTTIRKNYQSTIHCGSVIQAARIVEILNIKNDIKTEDDKLLRTGDQAKVKFEFMFRPEFMEDNALFIFRENNAKGVGKIISTINI